MEFLKPPWRRHGATAIRLVASLLTVALYAAVAFASPGYDDEIWNIDLVETAGGYRELVTAVNSFDFHTPTQYVINKLLFDLLGDWSWVRVANAVLVSATIVALWLATEVQGWTHRAFAYIVICLNPALLLWCTSLRWYAYFVPVLNLIVITMMKNPRRPLVYWSVLTAGSLALFYINYLGLIVAPAIFLVAFFQRRPSIRHESWLICGLVLVAAVLAYPQLSVFFSAHLINAGAATSGMVTTLAGLALDLSSNQGAMPLSVPGLALAAANIATFAIAAIKWRSTLLHPTSALFALSAVGTVAVRVRFRTLVTLSTLQGVFQTVTFGQTPSAVVRGLLLALFAIGNIGSDYNVVRHEGTTKGSWNTPYPLVLDLYRSRTASCASTTVVAKDPVLIFHLRRLVSEVISVGEEGWRERFLGRSSDCLVAFETFRGALKKETWAQYLAVLRSLPGKTSIDRIGKDDDAAFKRRFDPDVPDYYVTMTVFRK